MFKLYCILILLSLSGTAAAQNYFPLQSIKANWTFLSDKKTSPSGIETIFEKYYSHLTRDTIINGETFYLYNFGWNSYYLRNDTDSHKLYIYLPKTGEVHTALDFNLNPDDKFYSYLDGKKKEFTVGYNLTYRFWGKDRKLTSFKGDSSTYVCMDGLGFIEIKQRSKDWDYVTSISLEGGIFDSVTFNPITADITSAILKPEYSRTNFPLMVKVRAAFSMPFFHDIFHAEVTFKRADSTVFTGNFPVNNDLFFTVIVDPSILKNNDSMYTRVVYKDRSIFQNYDVYPDSGYYISRITAPVTSLAEDDLPPASFRISSPYPNPFNSSASVNLYLPVPENVNLTLYDILGNKVRVLNSGTLPPGEHTIKIDAGSLNTGVYLLHYNTGTRSGTYKLLHLK